MRYLPFLLVFLTASPAYAGPSAKRLLSVISAPAYDYVTSINGISEISDGAPDTGTQTLTFTAHPITANASCAVFAPGQSATVSLEVDGLVRDSLTCTTASASKGLNYLPTAGSHTVRIFGSTTDFEIITFTANTFRIPGTP